MICWHFKNFEKSNFVMQIHTKAIRFATTNEQDVFIFVKQTVA